MNFRIEKDSMGEIKVPADKYWGAQTQRSKENFQIGEETMPCSIIKAFAILKKASALANKDLGVLPEEKAMLIAQVCDEILENQLEGQFPLVVWQTGSGTQSNMNLNEVIANRAHVIKGGKLVDEKKILHPNDDVNKSQSSNDTFPTAMHIAAFTMLVEETIPAIEQLREELDKKAIEFKNIVKIGRTHWMDATPLTLGQEFSGYVSQLDHGLNALNNSLAHLSELALGGTAVGTGINAPENFDVIVAKHIADLTGLPFVTAENKFEAIANHDAIVESHNAIKQLAISINKIMNDIRLMASGPRSGIGELIIPANEPGSSIMPGKVNPTQIEAITMVCAQILGNDTSIAFGGANGFFELNVYKPVMIYNFLQSAKLLADACNSVTKHMVVGIQPDHNSIDRHVKNSLMLVTALNRHIGYDNAAKIAKKAHEENTTLKEAALALNMLTEKEFDEWVDPAKMVGAFKS